MENTSDNLMLTGVVALCRECGDEGLFVAADEGCAEAREYCCTRCDAAVFLVEVLDNTGVSHRGVA